MAIIDCFTFFNEHDVLEMRFKELYTKVDRFVICEANITHAGKEKPWNLEKHQDRYKDYLDKVIYVKADLCVCDSRWEIENEHRRYIKAGLRDIQPTDYVLISDVDEIPDLTAPSLREGVFAQRHSYYSLDWFDPRIWRGTVGVYGWRFTSPYGPIDPQDCRNFRDILQPVGSGWHVGWLGNYDRAREKVENFGHSELDTEEFKEAGLTHCLFNHKHPDGTQLVYSPYSMIPCALDYPQHIAGNPNDQG